MLYFIGLGLGDAKDITVKGLEVVKSAKKVFLEHYTSILSCGKADLEEFYGRNDLILADRDLVESGADEILEDAKAQCYICTAIVLELFLTFKEHLKDYIVPCLTLIV